MAESMQGLHRSHRCTEVNNTMIGNTVTVMGWVQKSRNKGGIIFVDLRDRSGILQVIFEEANCGAESFAKAEKLRSEFVVAITGEVAKRGGAVRHFVSPLRKARVITLYQAAYIRVSSMHCHSHHRFTSSF